MIDVRALVSEAQELEPLPASTTRLASLVAQPEWDLDEIVAAISFDQALAGMLLGLANSAVSGARVEVNTIRDAVGRVGAGTVLSLAVGARLKHELMQALPAYDIAEGGLFRHSVCAALAAQRAAEVTGTEPPPESFAAALLHDIGKLILGRFLPPHLSRHLREQREEQGLSWIEAENATLRINHAHLGGLVARSWKLPATIEEAVHSHHAPDEVENERARAVCRVVRLADCVAISVGAGTTDRAAPDLDAALADFGMTRETFDAYASGVAADLGTVLACYGAGSRAA